jgi:hypothetical protein
LLTAEVTPPDKALSDDMLAMRPPSSCFSMIGAIAWM